MVHSRRSARTKVSIASTIQCVMECAAYERTPAVSSLQPGSAPQCALLPNLRIPSRAELAYIVVERTCGAGRLWPSVNNRCRCCGVEPRDDTSRAASCRETQECP